MVSVPLRAQVPHRVGIDVERGVQRVDVLRLAGGHAHREGLAAGQGEEAVLAPVEHELALVVGVELGMGEQEVRQVVLDDELGLAVRENRPVQLLVARGHLEQQRPVPPVLLRRLHQERAHHRLDLLRRVLDLAFAADER